MRYEVEGADLASLQQQDKLLDRALNFGHLVKTLSLLAKLTVTKPDFNSPYKSIFINSSF